MSEKVSMKKLLKWSDDKITVVWCEGNLTNSERFDYFNPRYDETPLKFLNRIVLWVHQHEYYREKDRGDKPNEYVFSFFNDELGEEYDEFQEEMMTPLEVLECFKMSRNPFSEENIARRKMCQLVDTLGDIIFDENDFEKADKFIVENNIDMKQCGEIMTCAISWDKQDVVEFMIKKNAIIDSKVMEHLENCKNETIKQCITNYCQRKSVVC